MIHYGPRSESNIVQLHPDLQRLLREYARWASSELDLTVTDSFRGKVEQDAAFNARPQRSKKPWPTSAHNVKPSNAFDFAAYVGGNASYVREEMMLRQGALRILAVQLGIALKPLIDWDLPHVERVA